MPRIMRAVALMALLAVPMVHAQATTADLPDLATVTGATSTSDAETTATSDATTGETTAASTGDNSETSATDSAESTSTASDDTTASGTSATTTATFPDATTSSTTGSVFSLTGLPTIAGAGVPTLVIPYTAAAPFMQKSTMPEGTVFIAVGAVLAFMGACVLLWRGLVAWSINRSVKRAALASLRGPEKSGPTWKSGAIYGTGKHAYNKEYENGSSMSLDALTSAGKPIKPFKDDHDRRQSSAPQQGLFFSPTAQASNRASSAGFDKFDNRSSTYLPAGYYAPPAEGGGGRASTVGGSLAPYARHSTIASPSPPHSPGLPGSRATSGYYGSRDGLRQNDALRAPSRDGPSSALARDGYGNERSSFLYQQPSSSSLAVGTGGQQSNEQLSGQRAPSAVLDDLFQNHGRMNQG